MLDVAAVLQMPVLRSADPVVTAASGHLARPVRWVHSTELADIGPLLRGGDLVLTTGVALSSDAAALATYAGSLVDSGAAGLVVELGRRWASLPDHLVAECERLGLPLVALRREVRFAAVTQAVGERLIDEQLTELREAQHVHDTFTELSVAEAGPDEVLAAAQRLAGAAVVLESEQHQVLAYRAGPDDVTAFLDDWERRSRGVQDPERATWDPSNGWLVTRVGRRERGWGRLVIESPTKPPQRLTALAERAAAALAMHRLHDRTRDGQVRRLHHELLLAVLTDPADAELARRVRLAGVPVERCQYVGLVLRPAGAIRQSLAASLDELVTACLRAAELVRSPCLVAASESDVRMLLPIPGRGDPVRLVDRFAEHVRGRVPVVVTAGSPATALVTADRTLREALHVMASLRERPDASVVHRLEDLHLRGLLALLSDDDRLQAFTERELEPLRDADRAGDTQLLHTTRVVVEYWGSKSAAAQALNVSRPVLYERIARIERILGASLSDAEVRSSLHVAFLTDAGTRARRT